MNFRKQLSGLIEFGPQKEALGLIRFEHWISKGKDVVKAYRGLGYGRFWRNSKVSALTGGKTRPRILINKSPETSFTPGGGLEVAEHYLPEAHRRAVLHGMNARDELQDIIQLKAGGYQRGKKPIKKKEKSCADCGDTPCSCHTYSAQLDNLIQLGSAPRALALVKSAGDYTPGYWMKNAALGSKREYRRLFRGGSPETTKVKDGEYSDLRSMLAEKARHIRGAATQLSAREQLNLITFGQPTTQNANQAAHKDHRAGLLSIMEFGWRPSFPGGPWTQAAGLDIASLVASRKTIGGFGNKMAKPFSRAIHQAEMMRLNPRTDAQIDSYVRSKGLPVMKRPTGFSAQLQDIIRFGGDPRPRNTLGMFSGGQMEPGTDPRAIHQAYKVPQAMQQQQMMAQQAAQQPPEEEQDAIANLKAKLKRG